MPEPAGTDRTTDRTQAQAASIDTGGDDTHPSSANPSAPGFAPPAEPGDVGKLGPYRVLKELGKGGMGAVYLALDTRLNRRLALKVMLPEFAANAAAKERFLREARAAAQISHDNVVTVYEADERDGVPYIAMQLLQGYPLDEYLRRKGDLAITHVLRIARETAAGLAAAHAVGLVHRDVKPGNLWLEAPGGRVKVLDFGLARPVDAEHELTKSGAVVGTPAYMSPEQARGERVDARTDLFSLGAVLYRLCTGKLPFDGPSVMAVLMALGTAEPRPVRELSPAVPEPLAELIHRLLAKDPDARPRTADEVVKTLRGVAEGVAVPTALPAEPGPLPQVVAVPIHVTAQPEYNAFADLDATEAAPEPETQAPRPAAAEAARKKAGGKGLWVAVGFAALAVAVLGGVIIVIRNKDGSETKIEVPDGATVTIKGKGGKTLAQVGPDGKPPKGAADADRKAAEWVLSSGSGVTVNGDESRLISAVADLPRERFTLTAVSLHSNGAATDAALAVFKGCTGLTGLYLDRTPVTDAGLAHFKDCKGLYTLSLTGTAVTDAGLAHLKGNAGLAVINLAGTKVTDAGLAQFGECKGVVDLFLDNVAITDAGLAHLKGWTRPAHISLSGTKVTDAGLANLKGCKILGRLNLDGTKVTDAGLAHLSGCESLTALHLSGTAVTGEGMAHLKGNKSLIELWLQGGSATDAGLAHLNDCGALLYLALDGTQVGDAGVAHLKALKNLTRLGLSGTGVGDVGLAHLKDCKALTLLNVTKTKVTAKGLEDFSRALPQCKLDDRVYDPNGADTDRKAAEYVLSIGGVVRVNGEDRDIKAAGDLPKDRYILTHAYLGGGNMKVTDAGLGSFKGCTGLTVLHLGGSAATDAGLTNFKDCKGLRELVLDSTGVTDVGLANFKDCKGLTVLALRGTKVSDEGLAHLKDNKGITGLYLNQTKVTDAGLSSFKHCKGLSDLELSGTALTDAGLANFKDYKGLGGLKVDNTKVTDAGLAHLKGCTGLNQLALDVTGVTDAGLPHLKGLKGLTHLWLSHTAVSDAGIETLAGFTGLGVLGVHKTNLTADGVKKLAAALPKCQIVHDGGTIEPKR